jgi:hypothetical protein
MFFPYKLPITFVLLILVTTLFVATSSADPFYMFKKMNHLPTYRLEKQYDNCYNFHDCKTTNYLSESMFKIQHDDSETFNFDIIFVTFLSCAAVIIAIARINDNNSVYTRDNNLR